MERVQINTKKSMGYISTTTRIGNYLENEFLSEDDLEEFLKETAIECLGACWSRESELYIIKELIHRFGFTKEELFGEEDE